MSEMQQVGCQIISRILRELSLRIPSDKICEIREWHKEREDAAQGFNSRKCALQENADAKIYSDSILLLSSKSF